METNSIKRDAKVIWKSLTERHQLSQKQLRQETKLNDIQIYHASGWLAGEDKIYIINDDKNEPVYHLNIDFFF